jgi:hypothetical protein
VRVAALLAAALVLPGALAALEAEAPDPRPRAEAPDPAVESIPLRDNRIEAREQLAELVAWVEREKGVSHRHARIELYARAIVGQPELGLEAWAANEGRPVVQMAIRLAVLQALRPADRQAVLPYLRAQPWLVEAVEKQGWAAEAHDILRAGLEAGIDGGRAQFPDWNQPGAADWPAALALSARGDEYALLADCLVRSRDGARQALLVERLRKLPGFDWQAAVRRAWGRLPPTDYRDRQQGLAALAREAGAGGPLPAEAPAPVPAMAPRSPCPGMSFAPDGRPIPRVKRPAPADPVVAPATLDASSTRAEVDAWIDARAAEIPPEQKGIRLSDPMVARLAAIPPQHYPALLAAMERSDSWPMTFYLEAASLRAVKPEHHDIVLAALPGFPHLAEAVVAQHWEADALAMARAWFDAGHASRNNPRHMLAVVARAGGPEDHARLRTVLVQASHGYNQADLIPALAAMPGFDLDEAVRAAWRYRPEASYSDRQEGFCLVAASHGVAGALPLVIATAADAPDLKHRSGSRMKACRAWLQEQFGLDPAEADYRAWFATHQPLLGWDPEARRWKLPPGQGPAPSATVGF